MKLRSRLAALLQLALHPTLNMTKHQLPALTFPLPMRPNRLCVLLLSILACSAEERRGSSCGIEVNEVVMAGQGRVEYDMVMIIPLPLSTLPLLVTVVLLQPTCG